MTETNRFTSPPPSSRPGDIRTPAPAGRAYPTMKEVVAECAACLDALALEVHCAPGVPSIKLHADAVCDEFTKLQTARSCARAYGDLICYLEALLAEARERYDPTDATEGE